MTAKDQALRTNSIKSKVDKSVSLLCRLCGERQETISPVVAKCKNGCTKAVPPMAT